VTQRKIQCKDLDRGALLLSMKITSNWRESKSRADRMTLMQDVLFHVTGKQWPRKVIEVKARKLARQGYIRILNSEPYLSDISDYGRFYLLFDGQSACYAQRFNNRLQSLPA